MGRQSKLKQQRKTTAELSTSSQSQSQKGDIETLTQLGYGQHNQLRSPEIPEDRPEPQV
ncbi:hypothetical protein NIES970_25450 [[Synechococcus] sp. NIES-970]|uniref:hypothetical protein n=1 Tax=Picosynechococcus sp. NKBG15041c TaxID=1407650 RepID=UPI000428F01F|nr:hypothetical protein [Picosynechococcus sp. NKBG15041c]BAW97591.1 hypothetical protein NIES970_25450 [[Synechococcus] sp. NIES-970]